MTFPSIKRPPPSAAVPRTQAKENNNGFMLSAADGVKRDKIASRDTEDTPIAAGRKAGVSFPNLRGTEEKKRPQRKPLRPFEENNLTRVVVLGELGVQEADELEGLMLLSGGLLELEERAQDFPLDAQGPEDRDCFGRRLPDLLDLAQPHVDRGQVQRHERHFINKTLIEEALPRMAQRHLGGLEMSEIAQDLPLLPGGTEDHRRVAVDLPVELPCLEVERQRLLWFIGVDITADQVMASGEQELRILLRIDQREGLIENPNGGFSFAGVGRSDRLVDEGAGELLGFSDLAVDAARFIREGHCLGEFPLKCPERRPVLDNMCAQQRIAGAFRSMAPGDRERCFCLEQVPLDPQRIAEALPRLRLQVLEPLRATCGLGRTRLRCDAGEMDEMVHSRGILISDGVAAVDKIAHHFRMPEAAIAGHLDLLRR